MMNRIDHFVRTMPLIIAVGWGCLPILLWVVTWLTHTPPPFLLLTVVLTMGVAAVSRIAQ